MKKNKKKRLGEILVESGRITQQQLLGAIAIQKKTKEKLGEVLVSQGIITEAEINKIVEAQTGIKTIDLDFYDYNGDAFKLIPENIARRYKLVPLKKEKMTLSIAMADPFDIYALDDVALYTGLNIEPVFAAEKKVDRLINKVYSKQNIEGAIRDYKREVKEKEKASQGEEVAADEESSIVVDNAPIVKLLNNIVQEGIRRRASDIHIEPFEKDIRVRYRIDGELINAMHIETSIHQAVIARIKILSKMNIAEKRIPQDGAFTIETDNGRYDLRANILPIAFGEKACLRILDKNTTVYRKEDLGFFEEEQERFERLLNIPNGIILVTGPTGSGKTTTMYTALSELNDERKNIVTAEDPIEIRINGINQVTVNTKIGMGYPEILRAFLRQDPDIMMIGEIRDTETAEIAIRASITGHIVISTLHTNSSAGTIMRLKDMGIEGYLIAASLKGIIAQRLVRRVCKDCMEEYEADAYQKQQLDIPAKSSLKLVRGKGCTRCSQSGYYGRIAIAEIMEITKKHREIILSGGTEEELERAAREDGMKTMEENIKRALLEKKTSFDEYLAFVKFKEMEIK